MIKYKHTIDGYVANKRPKLGFHGDTLWFQNDEAVIDWASRLTAEATNAKLGRLHLRDNGTLRCLAVELSVDSIHATFLVSMTPDWDKWSCVVCSGIAGSCSHCNGEGWDVLRPRDPEGNYLYKHEFKSGGCIYVVARDETWEECDNILTDEIICG